MGMGIITLCMACDAAALMLATCMQSRLLLLKRRSTSYRTYTTSGTFQRSAATFSQVGPHPLQPLRRCCCASVSKRA